MTQTYKVTHDTSIGTKPINADSPARAAAEYGYLYMLPTDATNPDRNTIYVAEDFEPYKLHAFIYSV